VAVCDFEASVIWSQLSCASEWWSMECAKNYWRSRNK